MPCRNLTSVVALAAAAVVVVVVRVVTRFTHSRFPPNHFSNFLSVSRSLGFFCGLYGSVLSRFRSRSRYTVACFLPPVNG